jgi:hypothetical protein
MHIFFGPQSGWTLQRLQPAELPEKMEMFHNCTVQDNGH